MDFSRANENMERLTRGLDEQRQAMREEERKRARVTPTSLRWMVFVDGENFSSRFRSVAEAKYGKGFVPRPEVEQCYKRDTFLWTSDLMLNRLVDILEKIYSIRPEPVRMNYYTMTSGDAAEVQRVRESLWNLGFHPWVFQKQKGKRAKGVDITLTKDMLSHAFLDNFDLAVIFTGDGDYVPVIEEVKRLGKIVVLFAFPDGLNPELKFSSDAHVDPTKYILKYFTKGVEPPPVPASYRVPLPNVVGGLSALTDKWEGLDPVNRDALASSLERLSAEPAFADQFVDILKPLAN